ncbi:MAG: pullulanase-type alpha-1,6-glucosidase [Terracidiphilus sp.]|jgi:pullulanase
MILPALAQVPVGDARIHYYRPDGNYSGWAIYTWNASISTNTWCAGEVQSDGADSFGIYFDVPVNPALGSPAGQLGFIINNCNAGGTKDPGINQYLQVTEYSQGWVISANPTVFYSQPAIGASPIPAGEARIHYFRGDSTYTGWAIYSWNASISTNTWCSGETQITGMDSYGAYYDIPVNTAQGSPTGQLGFIINNCDNGQIKDPGVNQYLQITQYDEGWVLSGDPTVYTTQPSTTGIPPDDVRIHYYRPDGNYSGWGIYTWNASTSSNTWCSGEVQSDGTDSFGIYFDVPVNPAQGSPVGQLGFIINNCNDGGIKDPGPNQYLRVTENNQAWVVSGDPNVFTSLPTAAQIASAGFYSLGAFWIDRTTVAISPSATLQSGSTFSLLYSVSAALSITSIGSIAGGTAIPLALSTSGFTAAEAAQYPQLAGYTVFNLSPSTPLSAMQTALTGQIVVQANDSSGNLEYVPGVQDAGVLDDLFYYAGPLGATFSRGEFSINLWAPTAQSVNLLLYTHETDTTPAETVPMTNTRGVWSATGQNSWKGEYYLYDIHVYVPNQQQIVENLVTDPYSADIALNGTKTRIQDLSDESTKPPCWDWSSSPNLESLNDLTLYELHVREFSIADNSVPAQYQGTYLAFTNPETIGMNHLAHLARAGLKAVHIMPSFHIGSVNEDKTTWQFPTGNLSLDPHDGTQQQAAVTAVQNTDGYNFGYDPVHYFAPSGGYAFNPDDRVMEYREMVMGLHNIGLRVVQDVVFNHTYASGENMFSVLDEIVPNYYYRLNATGQIDTASCCSDTASEHRMFEKLMIDNLVQNAIQYKIDGFRFDDMSLHFVYNMQHIQQALLQLTLEKDGVDGSKIYLYGEGFQNPETAALSLNATQENLYGTGIGTFNDRIYNGIRGSYFYDSGEQVQGFATGLFTDPSAYTTTTEAQTATVQLGYLNTDTDWIRISLSGGLRDFTFVSSTGDTVKGSQVLFGAQPAGYTASPLESVNYASVHDGQPLFDAIQLRSAIPGTTSSGGDSIAMRTRRQVLAMSLIALGQGVPFFFGGDDLLRSKDMDNNSYNSGDWFNKVNWTYQGDLPGEDIFEQESSNWGIGLPLANVNESNWPIMQPLLANPALTPSPANISAAAEAFQMLLRIRNSSRLFHMGTLQEIQNNLHFLNTGATQVPGLIVMKLDAKGQDYGLYDHIVVVFNATLSTINFQSDELKNLGLQLHPLEFQSSDSATRASRVDGKTGTATVEALTTAIFVSRR